MGAQPLRPGATLLTALGLALPFGCTSVLGVSNLEDGGKGDVPLGGACDRAPICASQHCVDGVCCDSDCAGRCERCDGVASSGTCRHLPAGTNPGGECPAGSVCDGGNGCAAGGFRAAIAFGDAAEQAPLGLSVEENGHVAVAGRFRGTVDVGGGPLASAGGDDVLVFKLRNDASHAWSKRFGGSGDDTGEAVALAGSGQVAVAGRYHGTLTFEAALPQDPGGNGSGFVALLEPDGAPRWSRAFVGAGVGSGGAAVAFDDACGVVVAGAFAGKVDFGGGALGNGSSHQMFVACYDRDHGDYRWAKAFSAPGTLAPHAAGVANDGSVLVVGEVEGAPSFAPMAKPAGASDVFVMKLSANGDVDWAKLFGGPLADTARAVRVGGGGETLFTGGFRGAADFGAPKPLASIGGEDIFLASLDGDGKPTGAQRFGGAADDEATGVVVDGQGAVTLAGWSQGNLLFGSHALAVGGGQDAFLVKLAAGGTPLWARRIGQAAGAPTPGTRTATGLGVLPDGGLAVALAFTGSVDAGGGAITSKGGTDGVVAFFAP